MSCININSMDFKQLLRETNLPSIVLEVKINKWQKTNGIDNFPTSEQILNDVKRFKNSKVNHDSIDEIKTNNEVDVDINDNLNDNEAFITEFKNDIFNNKKLLNELLKIANLPSLDLSKTFKVDDSGKPCE